MTFNLISGDVRSTNVTGPCRTETSRDARSRASRHDEKRRHGSSPAAVSGVTSTPGPDDVDVTHGFDFTSIHFYTFNYTSAYIFKISAMALHIVMILTLLNL